MATDVAPVHDEFMDSDMRALWDAMTPLPGTLRLYGGTALALYLNHRESQDFDFFTSKPDVRHSSIASLPWLAGATLLGGEGTIEATCPGEHRDIKVTFLEVTELVPAPVDPPRFAHNGVAIAAPRDLVRAKLEAICSRGAARDYNDIAAAFRAWPELAAAAFHSLPRRSADDVAIAVANPPLAEVTTVNAADMATIRGHAAFRQRRA